MQIQKLEEQLGVIIFDRSKQPVVPTKIGKEIIAQARIVLSESGKIREMIEEEEGKVSGELRIGVIPTISPYLIPLFIISFSEQYPEVILLIEEHITEEILQRLMENKLDLGILATPSGYDSLNEQVIYNEEFVAYLGSSHPLNEVNAIDPFLLDADDVWVLDEGHCFREQVLNICQSPTAESPVKFKSGSLEALKRIVDNQGGMTLLPKLATYSLSPEDKRQLKWFKDPKPVREVSLVTHRSFLKRRLTEALFKAIKEALPADLSSQNPVERINWH
jgi:LysR family hydrogen peroxide-inducible transcriptional activator